MGNSGNKKVLAKSLLPVFVFHFPQKRQNTYKNLHQRVTVQLCFVFCSRPLLKKIPRKSPWKHKYKETRGGSRHSQCKGLSVYVLLVLRFMRNHALNALVRCHSNQKQHICHSWNRAKWAVSERKTHGDKGWRKTQELYYNKTMHHELWTELSTTMRNKVREGQRTITWVFFKI